jgi:hypothetical protein
MPSSSESDGGDEPTMTFDFIARVRLIDPPMSLDERREGQIEAHRLTREMYDVGVPLFTKDLLRDIARQLADSSSKAVSVTGLDGVAVQFPLKTASDCRHYYHGPDYYTIWYELIQLITDSSSFSFKPVLLSNICSLGQNHSSAITESRTYCEPTIRIGTYSKMRIYQSRSSMRLRLETYIPTSL